MLQTLWRWSLKFFRGMLLNGDPGAFVLFLRRNARKGGSTFLRGMWPLWKLWYGSNIIVFFVCEHDALTLRLYQVNAATLMKGGFLLADSKLQVSQDPWKSVTLVAFKKSIKIHREYDARPLIKSCNCY